MYLLNQTNELTAHSSGNVVSRNYQENDGPTQPMAETPTMEAPEESRDYEHSGEDVAMEIGSEDAVAPSSMSLRDVKITPLSSGFLVKVGCQSVAVETPETLLAALAKYYENPSEFERKWYSNTVINRLENILGK